MTRKSSSNGSAPTLDAPTIDEPTGEVEQEPTGELAPELAPDEPTGELAPDEPTGEPEPEPEPTGADEPDEPTGEPGAPDPVVTLARRATAIKSSKPRPIFRDVSGIPRVVLADGRIAAVQELVSLSSTDGELTTGAHQLSIVRRAPDGTESGQRFPLAEIQLIADAYASAGLPLV